MDNQLFIPQKLKVGFQLRKDTYSGKLGYVIYWDNKGKLRKETSWNSWCHKPDDKKPSKYDYEARKYIQTNETWGDAVAPIEIVNEPLEGFVLNKDVGGSRRSYGWDARMEKVRVFDPRGFEIEISIPNLLYILQECSSIKGKGLNGEFVYSWSGPELVLLPVGSEEHKLSLNFSEIQGKKISLKDLKVGYNYLNKKEETLCYVGRENFVRIPDYYFVKVSKEHIFWNFNTKQFTSNSDLAQELGPNQNFGEVTDIFNETWHGNDVESFKLGSVIKMDTARNASYYYRGRNNWLENKGFMEEGGEIFSYNLYYDSLKEGKVTSGSEFKVSKLKSCDQQRIEVKNGFDPFHKGVLKLSNGQTIEMPLNSVKINEINKTNKVGY
jgi:hypothetical protein